MLKTGAVYPTRGVALSTLLAQSVSQTRRVAGSIPPSSLVLLSSFAVQLGTAVAKSLFEGLGPIGAAFVCKLFAALLLIAIERPQLRSRAWSDYLLIALLGLSIAGMSLSFYGAIARIPIGIASALEFTGPLGVAILGSRRLLDWLWVGLAITGVILLSPLTSAALDPIGVVLALLSGGCWALFILVSAPAGQAFPKGTGLALAMIIATLMLAAPGIDQAEMALFHPSVPIIGLAAAFLGTVLPYSLEFAALKRMPPRIFGVLISIEPAIATLVGFLVLHEQLGLRSLVAIVLVTLAAIGVTLTKNN
jgi:inner membrane transporter RhtA